MSTKFNVGALALLMSLVMANHAFAGFLPSLPPADVPELDGPSSLAALALLASIGAIFFRGSKN
jgi:hypothetical protein